MSSTVDVSLEKKRKKDDLNEARRAGLRKAGVRRVDLQQNTSLDPLSDSVPQYDQLLRETSGIGPMESSIL